MDFTQLESLEMNEDRFFCQRMQHELPGLRHLTMLTHTNMSREARTFLQGIPPLESLSLRASAPYQYDRCNPRRAQFPLDVILAHHGPSLRSLRLHQLETDDPTQRRLALRPSQIRAIGRACPNLTRLGLDLDRNGTWPNATLTALASLAQVEALDLNFEIGADLNGGAHGDYGFNPHGIESGGRFREPRLSRDVAEALFADLRAMKNGTALRQLNVTVGDYEQRAYHGPLYLPSWEEGRARRFVCETVGEKGDGRPPFCSGALTGLGNEWDDDGDLEGGNETTINSVYEQLELR